MTTVTAAMATPTGTSSGPIRASGSLDPNTFLSLLVAELQYQDPTKPMDTAQLVQQLAVMSQVEQSTQTNAKLSAMLDQLAFGQSPSLIGRTITSPDGALSGIVAAVKISEAGTQAILENGRTITLERGVMISK